MIGAGAALAAAFGVMATVLGVIAIPVMAIATIGFEALGIAAGVSLQILLPLALAFGVLMLFIAATKKEGQSFGDRFMEVFTAVSDFTMGFFIGFGRAYTEHMAPVFTQFSSAAIELWEGAIKPIFQAINEAFGTGETSGEELGAAWGHVFGWIGAKASWLTGIIVDVLVPAFVWGAKNFVIPWIRGLGQVAGGFRDLITGARGVKESMISIFVGMFNVLLNTAFLPLKMSLIGILTAAAAVGAISNKTATSITGLLNAEPGTLLGDTPLKEGDGDDLAGAALAAATSNLEYGNQDPNIALNGNLETTVKGCVNSTLEVEGKALAVAGAEAEFELAQRGGFTMSPFLQTQIVTNGNPAR